MDPSWVRRGLLLWTFFGWLDLSAAEEPATPAALAEVIVTASPLPGTAVDTDKVPGNVQHLTSCDLARDGPASLTDSLNSRLGSVTVNDNLDDPFQPDILYRGFEASPVVGTPQGLAVYQNGVRINEAFGDVVNWDLVPDFAINRADVVSANPIYGLNALGGAISVGMKDGFSYPRGEAEALRGSFGRRAVTLQYGANDGRFGLYIGGKTLDEIGWREFSHDSLRQLYMALSGRTDRWSLDLSYTRANNALMGQGAAPVQELAVDRSLVFTGPQSNDDRLDFGALNAAYRPRVGLGLQSLLYYRAYRQSVANGNTTDYTACTSAAHAGALCQPDGMTPLTNAAGETLADISNGGTLDIGENDTESIRAWGRGGALQLTDTDALQGRGNQFSAGVTLDFARVVYRSTTQVGLISPQLLVLPSDLVVDTPEGTPFGATPVEVRANNQYYGLYATDTLDLTSAFSVTASGRYNVAEVNLTDLRGSALTGDNRYTHFNPALGGTYRLTSTVTAYVGFEQNTRTPTASEIECSDPARPCLLPSSLSADPPTLRQVVAHTYELGLRGKAPVASATTAQFSWNLGLFRTELHDDIYGVSSSVSTGYFQNVGATRRQGLEAGLTYGTERWSFFVNGSYVAATFESQMTLHSPSNPLADADGNIQVRPGDDLPGIPRGRIKLGLDTEILANWTVGATLALVGESYYRGDESNQNPPLPGYHVLSLHCEYRAGRRVEFFATVQNLLSSRYSTFGLYGDPTGAGAPGVPIPGLSNGPAVDNRFVSPAAPFSAYGGVRVRF